MESKYSYQFTKSAKNDLEKILHYIKVELNNPTATTSFINKFQESVTNIQLFPKSYPKVMNKFLPEYTIIRKKLINNYILYYSVNYNLKGIIVLRIVFSHRDIDSIFKNENQ